MTITGVAANKVYDGTTTATLNFGSAKLVGVLPGDAVTLNTSNADPVGSFASQDVGNGISVPLWGLSIGGAQAGDYSLNPTTTANITPAPLTVSGVTASNKVYDGTTTATLNLASAKLVGVVAGDAVTLNTSKATGAFASSAVGTGISVAIAGLTLSGAQAGDYTLTQPTTTANITSAGGLGFTSDTPTAGTYGSHYSYQFLASGGGSMTYSATGLPSWATLNPSTGVLSGTPTSVGAFMVTVTASNGVSPSATANVSLTVQAAHLTVTGVTAANKVYDGKTTAALNLSSAALVGVVSGDSVTLNTSNAVGVFASKAVGNGVSVAVSGLSLGGAQASDYSLVQPTTTANITPSSPTTPTGLQVVSATSGPGAGTLGTIRLTFSQAVVPSSFTLDDLSLLGATNRIAITAVTPVPGSGNTAFDLSFATQTAAGKYTLYVGSNAKDAAGDHLALYQTQFVVAASPAPTGLQVVSATSGPGAGTLGTIRLTFSQAVVPSSFTLDDLSLLSATNRIAITAVTPVPGSGNTAFDLSFATQTAAGKYTLYVGSNAKDAAGDHLALYQTQFVVAASPRPRACRWSASAAIRRTRWRRSA